MIDIYFTIKGTFYAIVYWTMMKILYLIYFFLYVMYHHFSHKFQFSDILSFLSQLFEVVKELYKFQFTIFILHQHWKIKDNNIQLWQQKQPYFAIFWSIDNKNTCQYLSTIKAKLHSSIIFQKQHSIFYHIVNKSAQVEEADFGSCLLSCYTLMKPNKSV